MRKWLAFLLVAVVLLTLHEGVHALIAVIYGEYYAFHWSIFPQVIFRTPTEERIGIQWAVISGTSSLVTLSLGYLLLALGRRIARTHSMFLKASIYYLTLISLFSDAFNLYPSVPLFMEGMPRGLRWGLASADI